MVMIRTVHRGWSQNIIDDENESCFWTNPNSIYQIKEINNECEEFCYKVSANHVRAFKTSMLDEAIDMVSVFEKYDSSLGYVHQ